MTQLLTGAPIWVWPLLAVLIIIGLRARHERTVPVVLLYGLPALGILAIRSTAGLSGDAVVWLVFAVFYVAGAWGGYLVQRAWILDHDGSKVRLAGENLTLSVMMIVFWANFVSGFLEAVATDIYTSGLFHMVFAALLGVSSGSFAGRAFRALRVVRGAA